MTLTAVISVILFLFVSLYLLNRFRPRRSKQSTRHESSESVKGAHHVHRPRRGSKQFQPQFQSTSARPPYSHHLNSHHVDMTEEELDELRHYENPDDVLGIAQPTNVVSVAKSLKPPVQAPKPALQQVVALNLKAATGESFNGYELLQTILSHGLRYGEMSIFHRHEQKTGQGKVLFSLVSMTKPGTFDLRTMGTIDCLGLTLFFLPSQSPDPVRSYELMIETIYQLQKDLGGEILDERREPLTQDKIHEHREMLQGAVIS